jgi:MoaA/NifB/PqqE/SkfB family radical SAM enzyme
MVEKNIIIIRAKNFSKGNLNKGFHHFGRDLVIDGGKSQGFAEYEFDVSDSQLYELWSRYASAEYRPVDIYIDGKLITKSGLSRINGGWTRRFLQWYKEFEIYLKSGQHRLKIICPSYIPHIEKFAILQKGLIPSFIYNDSRVSHFYLLKEYLLKQGVKETVQKISNAVKLDNLKNRYLEILGIFDGRYAYKGPFHVQIDLTNECNNSCIACWCNSPLLKERRLSYEKKQEHLPFGMVKDLIDEIASMGTTEVYYSGSGEPFMHPQIMAILEYTKKKRLTCHVNTNFTLLDKEKLDCLINLGVDFLTVSLWAATAEVYVKTHLNRKEEDFYKIRDNLIYLNTHKKNNPKVKLYNVIFNMNYFEIEKMIDFAKETNSESLEFTLVDTIPGATDILTLNDRELSCLKELCKQINSRLIRNNIDKNTNVLLFQFEQFLRRITISEDVKEAKYDKNIIDSMPCYIGWLFARIVPNGQVHSCLKAHRIPTGSLYLNRFSEIWNSPNQINFRKNTLVYEKNNYFFRLIGNDSEVKEAGCYKSCDDIGRNAWMHKRVNILSSPERTILKGIAKILKSINKFDSSNGQNYRRFHKDPIVAGIRHGRKAFIGPEQVVIDPTNRCNLRCISCWLYSPYLSKDKPSSEWLKRELSKKILIRLIDDLSEIGTKRIRFTGGGEPFMHKELIDIIEHARSRGILVAITTNLGLVQNEDIKRIINLGLEELCVSIWASNAEIYCKVHPGSSTRYFDNLKEKLLFLREIKVKKPKICFANVIMNCNFKDFAKMYEFGKEYGADSLYFTIADVFCGQTDRLLFSETERQELLVEARQIEHRAKNDNIKLEFFSGFLRRLSKPQDDFKKGEYDKYDIDKIPCYIGWVFSRILADGSVAPCCRGVKKVMGNINETSFKDIWFSSQYNEFRAKAKYLYKANSYFKDIRCIKECDNLMHNEEMHRRIYSLRSSK